MNWEYFQCPAVFFAAVGAFVMQALTLMEIRNIPKTQRPDFKDFFYWLPFLIAPLAGAFLAFAYVSTDGPDSLKPYLAINVGVSAPLILRSMATNVPTLQQTGEGA